MAYRTALRRAGAPLRVPVGPQSLGSQWRRARSRVLNNPVVSAPIVGATKPHHLDDAAATVDINLTSDEVTALEEHYQVRPTGGF